MSAGIEDQAKKDNTDSGDPNCTDESIVKILGKAYPTRKDADGLLKILKEKEAVFSSVTRSSGGKPKSNEDLYLEIAKCRPRDVVGTRGLLAWFVDVSNICFCMSNIALKETDFIPQQKILEGDILFYAAKDLGIGLVRLVTLDELKEQIKQGAVQKENSNVQALANPLSGHRTCS
jgi:hypothetical protein